MKSPTHSTRLLDKVYGVSCPAVHLQRRARPRFLTDNLEKNHIRRQDFILEKDGKVTEGCLLRTLECDLLCLQKAQTLCLSFERTEPSPAAVPGSQAASAIPAANQFPALGHG
jgi:hypothetical protein